MTLKTIKTLADGLWRWRGGRQNAGYDKMLLVLNPFLVPWDCYLLRFREGASIDPHTDPVSDRRHFRLNVVLVEATEGGDFQCESPIIETRRIKYFRPDLDVHSVTQVSAGTRYVLSIGWALKK